MTFDDITNGTWLDVRGTPMRAMGPPSDLDGRSAVQAVTPGDWARGDGSRFKIVYRSDCRPLADQDGASWYAEVAQGA